MFTTLTIFTHVI